MPKPLPLVWMNPQRVVMRANSAPLKVAFVNLVSVTP
jgi:hypothetical protein